MIGGDDMDFFVICNRKSQANRLLKMMSDEKLRLLNSSFNDLFAEIAENSEFRVNIHNWPEGISGLRYFIDTKVKLPAKSSHINYTSFKTVVGGVNE